MCFCVGSIFFFQAEDGIRDLVRSRGLGDVYKRQVVVWVAEGSPAEIADVMVGDVILKIDDFVVNRKVCLLYTSDAADERSSVDLGGRRIIKKKKQQKPGGRRDDITSVQQHTMHTTTY